MNLLSYHVQVFKLVWNLGDIKGLKKIVIEILLPVYLIFHTWPPPPPEKKNFEHFLNNYFFPSGIRTYVLQIRRNLLSTALYC